MPLYNAVVYVVEPGTLPELERGAECESCSAHFPERALAVGQTDAHGRFTITDMPAGQNVPLVIQLGKWRRVIEIPFVAPCTDTQLEPGMARLPRSQREGDLPRIAMATGGSDALECLLKKLGIDESEFTSDAGSGSIHVYSGFRAAKVVRSGQQLVPLTPAEELWESADKMLQYDMMLLGCEGNDNLWNEPDDLPDGASERPPSMHLEVRRYADLGGRIFGSHWGHRWINSDGVTPDHPYPEVATFGSPAGPVVSNGVEGELTASVDTSFPKGLAFREWLFNVGASPVLGQLPLVEAEHTVDAVDGALAQRWLYGLDMDPDHDPNTVQYFSFTTPVGELECGRMVFSDVHVSFGGQDYADVPFPERCLVSPQSELSPQEKALAFLIFDLSSCIQKEDDVPPMPVVVK
jgi:hypothetical protein